MTQTHFPNLARGKEALEKPAVYGPIDETVLAELAAAGIKAEGLEYLRGNLGEVPTQYVGSLCLWTFKRAWYYWVAEGPGVPPAKAEPFHQTWGKQVRVAGHCGCPSPREIHRGFAVGLYHIDSQEGLNAFAELLRSIYIERLMAW